jgi:SAM-dependent methyltransferase
MSSETVWHDVECGGYAADLSAWERLADATDGPLLELGSGTGRVSLHLARRGHEVWALDANPALLEALRARAAAESLSVRATCADIRAMALERDFELIIAPMQVLQMLSGEAARVAALERVAAHLSPGGRLAAAIVERPAAGLDGSAAALPDVREVDGWVYSSFPIAVGEIDGGLDIRRVRQAVAPDGALSEEEHTDHLDALDADLLEAQAAGAGLAPVERLDVPSADGYLGSTVVLLERP